jgi:hypothetical protein
MLLSTSRKLQAKGASGRPIKRSEDCNIGQAQFEHFTCAPPLSPAVLPNDLGVLSSKLTSVIQHCYSLLMAIVCPSRTQESDENRQIFVLGHLQCPLIVLCEPFDVNATSTALFCMTALS